jgi:excisionase family DNA binding protein
MADCVTAPGAEQSVQAVNSARWAADITFVAVDTLTRDWLTVREVAERAAVSTWTVRRWIDCGELRAFRWTPRGRLRVSLNDAEALLARAGRR